VKIDDSIKKAAGLPVSTTSARGGKGADKAEAVKPVSDKVELSSQVQALAARTAGAGVFDAKKVEEIKTAIASGTFRVDPKKVANGLLDMVSDLNRSRKA